MRAKANLCQLVEGAPYHFHRITAWHYHTIPKSVVSSTNAASKEKQAMTSCAPGLTGVTKDQLGRSTTKRVLCSAMMH